MTVMLKSLRVTSEMDASPYARGAQQKVAADKQMIESDRARSVSLAAADALMQKAIPGMSRLSKAYLEGYSEAAKFESQVRSLGNSLDKGMPTERAVAIYGNMAEKFGLVANSANLAKDGYVSLVPVIDQVNAALLQQAQAADAVAAALADQQAMLRVNDALEQQAALAADVAREERAIKASLDPVVAVWARYTDAVDAANAALTRHGNVGLAQAQKTALLQGAQNEVQNMGLRGAVGPGVSAQQILGQSGASKSARDSAAAFEQMQIEQDRMAAAAANLKREIDPLGAAVDRLNAELAEYQTMANIGLISTQQLAMAQDLAATKFAKTQEYLGHVGTGVRLTQHEIANLSYQFNDIAVMMASGQAPFMMLMQQGMQIGQIIGPQGLGGGVKALGAGLMSFLLNPVNLAVVGFASLAGVASSYFSSSKDELPKVNSLLDQQRELLSRVKEAYGDIADVAPESARVLNFEVAINNDQVKAQTERRMQALVEGILPYKTVIDEFGTAVQQLDLESPFLPFRDILEQTIREMEAGTYRAGEFRDEIVTFADANPHLAGVAQQITKLFGPLDEATRKFEALHNAARNVGSPRDAGTRQLMGIISGARGEADRLQAGYALDIREMNATTPGQKADIAAERERLSLMEDQVHPIEAAARIEFARRLALAQATKELAEQTRQIREQVAEQDKQRLRAANDNVANAGLGLAMAGATPWASQEAQANLQAYMDLRKQAEDNGQAFDAAQYERLKALNAQAAELNRLTAIRSMELDIGREREALNMPSTEARIAQRLEGAGIMRGTAAFEQLATTLREIQQIESSFGYGFKTGLEEMAAEANDFAGTTQEIMGNFSSGLEDVWVNFAKTGELEFTSLIDTMITDLARLSYQLAMSGLMNSFGLGQQQSGGLGGLLGGLFGGGGFGGSNPVANLITDAGMGVYAKGGVFRSGREIEAFASGGIVSRPTYFPMAGGRTGLMGEAGDEAIMPLRRGSDGRLGVAAAGGGAGAQIRNEVKVYNYNGGQVQQREKPNESGGMTTEIYIRKQVERYVPEANRKSIPGAFGVPPAVINR